MELSVIEDDEQNTDGLVVWIKPLADGMMDINLTGKLDGYFFIEKARAFAVYTTLTQWLWN